jgi:hypothetical protein
MIVSFCWSVFHYSVQSTGSFFIIAVWFCWSGFHCVGSILMVNSSSSWCIYLSTTKVEHLGSITILEVLKLKSVRNEFTCSYSFLARLLVSGPWFVSFMLEGRWLIFELACTIGTSSSSSLSWNRVILDSDSSKPKNGVKSTTLKDVLTPQSSGDQSYRHYRWS